MWTNFTDSVTTALSLSNKGSAHRGDVDISQGKKVADCIIDALTEPVSRGRKRGGKLEKIDWISATVGYEQR
jgi:hypothetical protein